MVRVLRWLGGYALFEVSGGFPERFMNLCKLNGANVWNSECESGSVRGCVHIKEYYKLEDAAKRSGMNISSVAERGFPVFVKQHKWRCGIAAGFVLSVVFIWFVSGFVWQVELSGEHYDGENTLLEDIEAFGVYSGARKSDIDILRVQEQVLMTHEDINWISVNIFGGKAVVEYTVVNETTPVKDTGKTMNMVALKQGKIKLVEVYEGNCSVKEGEYVREGDLLISGIVSMGDGTEKIVCASGKVFAYTENELVFSESTERNGYVSSTGDSTYSVFFFGLKIPLGDDESGKAKSVTDIYATGNGTVLPVGVIRYDTLDFCQKEVALSDEQTLLMCLREAVGEKRRSYKECELIEITYSCVFGSGKATVNVYISCVENIAVEQEFYVEKN